MPSALPISRIQGSGLASPHVGKDIQTSGLVTALRDDGFFIQSDNPDSRVSTSEGIFIATNSEPTVRIGDQVAVTGRVEEAKSAWPANGLSLTQVANPEIEIHSRGNELPAPVAIGTPPKKSLKAGVRFWEKYEGMRIAIDDPLVISPTSSKYGDFWVLANGGNDATSRTVRNGTRLNRSDYNPERLCIQLEPEVATALNLRVGDALRSITGVLTYERGVYKLLPTEKVKRRKKARYNPQITRLRGTATKLTIASFNVKNLDPKKERVSMVNKPWDVDDDVGDGRFDAVANQIVTNLKAPDIVALQEVMDNDGFEMTDETDASATYERFIAAIVDAGGPEYSWTDLPPENDADGGAKGGNIRCGYLYQPERVELIENSVERLFVDDDEFVRTRKPLKAQFRFNDEVVTVVNNHSSARLGSDAMFGAKQPPLFGFDFARESQAAKVNGWVQDAIAEDADANVVVVGDLNDNEFRNSLEMLAGDELVNLTDRLDVDDRYTFCWEGNSQAIDHILVSKNLSRKARYDIVHVNSDFADQVSDHDPVIARLSF